eukprot:scaffold3515_cov126-Cylindrotheca_fusiformis.AAC.29
MMTSTDVTLAIGKCYVRLCRYEIQNETGSPKECPPPKDKHQPAILLAVQLSGQWTILLKSESSHAIFQESLFHSMTTHNH